MRFWGLLAASMFVAGTATAGVTFDIQPPKGKTALEVTKEKNYLNVTGSCGAATIQVTRLQKSENPLGNGYFEIDWSSPNAQPSLIIHSTETNKTLTLKQPFIDDNYVGCVHTKAGDRLLIGTRCLGRICSESFLYHIYDLQNLKSITPKKKDGCDVGCAEKVLGQKLDLQ